MRRLILLAASLVALALPAAAGARPSALPHGAKPSCGFLAGTPVAVSHVIVIVMENHSYADLIGRRGSAVAARAPYINGLKRACGLATNYHSLTHPSLPNYVAMVAGSNGGITTDCTSCTSRAHNLFRRLGATGGTWRVYAESMPSRCSHTSTLHYLKRHNPATYFPAIRSQCDRWDVPMGGASGRFATALAHNTLPDYAMVVPNPCDDMHDCSVSTGDTWLATWVPRILQSGDYRAGHTAVFIVWDEGEGGGYGGENCLAHLADRSCHVPALVLSGYTAPGARSSTQFSHLSLLRTTQTLLGATPYLGAAGRAHGMSRAFGL
jgi:phosphatidylinositol-3-phosphatase